MILTSKHETNLLSVYNKRKLIKVVNNLADQIRSKLIIFILFYFIFKAFIKVVSLYVPH